MDTVLETETYKAHIYDVIGAIHEVHKELGPGLTEYCYQEGMQIQLEEQGVSFKREVSLHPTFHGKEMAALYRIDFLCKDDIIVECKAVTELTINHRAQLFNYMRITHQYRGIIFNFGEKGLYTERYLYLSEFDDFILLNQDNYQEYIDG